MAASAPKIAGGDIAFDAWHLIRPATLTDYTKKSLDGPAIREAVAALSG